MENYREIYCNAIYRLGEAYGTADCEAARENYYNVVRDLALNAGRFVEIVRSDFDELFENDNRWEGWNEAMADFAKYIEILHSVNYPWVAEWEREYQLLKDWIAAPPPDLDPEDWLETLTA